MVFDPHSDTQVPNVVGDGVRPDLQSCLPKDLTVLRPASATLRAREDLGKQPARVLHLFPCSPGAILGYL